MICQSCRSEIQGAPKFCPKCGGSTLTAQQTPKVPGKFCPQCGTENPLIARFCKQDGYRFESAPLVPQSEPPLPRANLTQPPAPLPSASGTSIAPLAIARPPATVRPPPPMRPPPPSVDPNSKPAGRFGASAIAGVVSAAVIVVGALLAFAYWKGYIGDRQASVAAAITVDLRGKGFDAVALAISKDS